MTSVWTSKTLPLTETDQAQADALLSKDTDKASYYAARIFWTMWPLHQVHNGCKTSSWMKVSVLINNVVDALTISQVFTLSAYAQFWTDTFEGNDIRVREARAGEKLVTWSGRKRELNQWPRDYGYTSVALAGAAGRRGYRNLRKPTVMSWEAAVFNGKSIRKTRSSQPTLWSSRLEKGTNVATVNEALMPQYDCWLVQRTCSQQAS